MINCGKNKFLGASRSAANAAAATACSHAHFQMHRSLPQPALLCMQASLSTVPTTKNSHVISGTFVLPGFTRPQLTQCPPLLSRCTARSCSRPKGELIDFFLAIMKICGRASVSVFCSCVSRILNVIPPPPTLSPLGRLP